MSASAPASPPPLPDPLAAAGALIKRSKHQRATRFWLEALILFTIATLIAILLVRQVSRSVVVVLARDVRRGDTIGAEDLALAALPRIDGTFAGRREAIGLTADSDLPRGSVLRQHDLVRDQVVAAAEIPRGTVFSIRNVVLKASPFDPGVALALPLGRTAARSIPSGTVLRSSMIGPKAPGPQQPDPGQLSLPLRAFVGPQPPPIGSFVTLVVIRKDAQPTLERARLLAIDVSKDPATIVVSASEAMALRITNPAALEIHVMRR